MFLLEFFQWNFGRLYTPLRLLTVILLRGNFIKSFNREGKERIPG